MRAGALKGRGGSKKGGGGGPFVLVIFAIAVVLAPVISRLLAMAVSRQREYLADASAAELTRNPAALASALTKIDRATEPTRSIKKGHGAPLHRGSARPRGERPGGIPCRPVRDTSANQAADHAPLGNGLPGDRHFARAAARIVSRSASTETLGDSVIRPTSAPSFRTINVGTNSIPYRAVNPSGLLLVRSRE